jgi:hypothetical protein
MTTPDLTTILRAASDDALRAFETATAQHDSARASYWLGACVALRRVAQEAGVSLAGVLPSFTAPTLLPDAQDDPLEQWERERETRQQMARLLSQVIQDQRPDEAIATLAATIQAVVAPQLAAQTERRARQLYHFLEMARGLETSADDHTEQRETLALVFAASVSLE